MTNAKSYRDLDIYQASYDLAITVHGFTLGLPQYELYEQGSQLRRASKSVAACIVEGYGRKRYKAEFVKFLVYAHASCDEVVAHLNLVMDTHNLSSDQIGPIIQAYEDLSKKIHRFILYVDRNWKGSLTP